MSELKACPAGCGESILTIQKNRNRMWTTWCQGCGWSVMADTEEASHAAWNRRAPVPVVTVTVADIDAVIDEAMRRNPGGFLTSQDASDAIFAMLREKGVVG